jgi:hypothetical protein
MATPAQITANRANALKSTGPRTLEGKATARFNALKHGLDANSLVLPGEDPAEYDALVRDYYASSNPATPEEAFHVDTMIRADWNKRRLGRVEAQLYRTVLTESGSGDLAAALLSDSPAAKLLARIQRQLAAFERSWYRAHREIHRARREAETADQAAFEALLNAPLPASPYPPSASFPEIPPLPASRPAEPLSNPALRL